MDGIIFHSVLEQRNCKIQTANCHETVLRMLKEKRAITENVMLHNQYTSAITLVQHQLDEVMAEVEMLNQRLNYLTGAI